MSDKIEVSEIDHFLDMLINGENDVLIENAVSTDDNLMIESNVSIKEPKEVNKNDCNTNVTNDSEEHVDQFIKVMTHNNVNKINPISPRKASFLINLIMDNIILDVKEQQLINKFNETISRNDRTNIDEHSSINNNCNNKIDKCVNMTDFVVEPKVVVNHDNRFTNTLVKIDRDHVDSDNTNNDNELNIPLPISTNNTTTTTTNNNNNNDNVSTKEILNNVNPSTHTDNFCELDEILDIIDSGNNEKVIPPLRRITPATNKLNSRSLQKPTNMNMATSRIINKSLPSPTRLDMKFKKQLNTDKSDSQITRNIKNQKEGILFHVEDSTLLNINDNRVSKLNTSVITLSIDKHKTRLENYNLLTSSYNVFMAELELLLSVSELELTAHKPNIDQKIKGIDVTESNVDNFLEQQQQSDNKTGSYDGSQNMDNNSQTTTPLPKDKQQNTIDEKETFVNANNGSNTTAWSFTHYTINRDHNVNNGGIKNKNKNDTIIIGEYHRNHDSDDIHDKGNPSNNENAKNDTTIEKEEDELINPSNGSNGVKRSKSLKTELMKRKNSLLFWRRNSDKKRIAKSHTNGYDINNQIQKSKNNNDDSVSTRRILTSPINNNPSNNMIDDNLENEENDQSKLMSHLHPTNLVGDTKHYHKNNNDNDTNDDNNNDNSTTTDNTIANNDQKDQKSRTNNHEHSTINPLKTKDSYHEKSRSNSEASLKLPISSHKTPIINDPLSPKTKKRSNTNIHINSKVSLNSNLHKVMNKPQVPTLYSKPNLTKKEQQEHIIVPPITNINTITSEPTNMTQSPISSPRKANPQTFLEVQQNQYNTNSSGISVGDNTIINSNNNDDDCIEQESELIKKELNSKSNTTFIVNRKTSSNINHSSSILSKLKSNVLTNHTEKPKDVKDSHITKNTKNDMSKIKFNFINIDNQSDHFNLINNPNNSDTTGLTDHPFSNLHTLGHVTNINRKEEEEEKKEDVNANRTNTHNIQLNNIKTIYVNNDENDTTLGQQIVNYNLDQYTNENNNDGNNSTDSNTEMMKNEKNEKTNIDMFVVARNIPYGPSTDPSNIYNFPNNVLDNNSTNNDIKTFTIANHNIIVTDNFVQNFQINKLNLNSSSTKKPSFTNVIQNNNNSLHQHKSGNVNTIISKFESMGIDNKKLQMQQYLTNRSGYITKNNPTSERVKRDTSTHLTNNLDDTKKLAHNTKNNPSSEREHIDRHDIKQKSTHLMDNLDTKKLTCNTNNTITNINNNDNMNTKKLGQHLFNNDINILPKHDSQISGLNKNNVCNKSINNGTTKLIIQHDNNQSKTYRSNDNSISDNKTLPHTQNFTNPSLVSIKSRNNGSDPNTIYDETKKPLPFSPTSPRNNFSTEKYIPPCSYKEDQHKYMIDLIKNISIICKELNAIKMSSNTNL